MFGAASTMAASALPLHAFPRVGDPQASAPPTQQPYPGSSRASWMQDPRYCWGVMTHYLADWQARSHHLDMNPDLWNKLVDGFDVEGMAKRLESVGAGHYQLSIGQNSGYYLSPNPTYDKITGIQPSKCSHRDLVADLYEPLRQARYQADGLSPVRRPGSGQNRRRRSRMAETVPTPTGIFNSNGNA